MYAFFDRKKRKIYHQNLINNNVTSVRIYLCLFGMKCFFKGSITSLFKSYFWCRYTLVSTNYL